MADTMPDRGGNAERENRHSEALRGDERKSSEPDRRDSGEEETVTGVQGTGNVGEISSESADVGGLQGTGGGGNTSRDSLRNITSETAEPEKVSAVSDLSDNGNFHEYPYVTVKGGRNYELLIAPELEEKDYSVTEFNAALNKLNERWNDDEYEGKTAFVSLTVHLSETETFEKRLYAEYLFDSLSERLEYDDDIFDKEVKLRQAVREAENQTDSKQSVPEYTSIEKAFLNSDTAGFMAKAVLSWDEIESIGYRLFEKGYNDRYSPNEKATFGNGISEPELYDIAKRMQSGENIRKELSSALLGGQKNFTTARENEFEVEYGSEYITARYQNAEKRISYEDMGNAFLNLIESEHNDIVHDRTVEDLQYVLHDLSNESAENLLTAFDNAAKLDWENSRQEQQQIKSALYDILGDDEQAEKAFESIAKWKYNYEPIKEDNLEFHFGNGKDDDWISESNTLHDFALANPDCSFALGNAVLEYLDEKQHTERNIPELKAGWYKKTKFDITATVGGEDFHYEGRFDIGDGKGTGGGSLLDHIRDFNQGIMDYSGFPYNTPEAKEQAKNTLEILVPFLEKNSVLTEKEQEILAEFKISNPIRKYDDIAKEALQEVHENSAEKIAPDVPDTVSIGDKFRNKTTGDISEVVSLTGALPWYTDDCTVKRESGGFEITENISYEKLLDPNRYEYIGNAELSSEKLQQENQQYIDTIKNLNQLKNTLTVGTEFEVTDHVRPECIGQTKRVTSVNTVGFTTQVIDKDGNPDGRDIHMEWSKAKNWNFKDGECNALLESGEKLMSFKVRKNEAPEIEKPVQQADSEPMQTQEKPSVQKSVDDLRVGDVIKFDGGVWRISEIQDDFSASLENTDKNSLFQSRSIWGNWKESLEREGFEYVPVKDVIEQGLYETQPKAEKLPKDFISDGQMSMFGEIPDIEEIPDKVIQQPEPEGEQLEMFHIEENRPYQIITYHSTDGGADEQEDYATLKEARKRAKEYLKDNYDGMETSAWEGYAIYNRDTQTIEETDGNFPSEKIFSFDILLKNGVITPEQEPEMIKKFMEEEIHDKVLSELLKSDDMKTAAKNNTREDFAFSYYEAVNNTLIEMLENNPRYAVQKEISYLLDDEEYLHNVFGDYYTVLQQLAPEKANAERVTVTQEQVAEKENHILAEQSGQPTINRERATVIQAEEKNMPKISDMEEHIRDDLLNALLDNRNDIPSGKSMDFNGSGYQITYNDRARMLETELKNNKISIPEAINVMRLIGFQFDKDKITFERPDTSKIHNAFDKFRENHSELPDNTRKFLERAEIIMANRFMENFQDVVSNSVMTFSYGQPDKINENVFGGKLDEVTKEINGYINEFEQAGHTNKGIEDKSVEQPKQQEVHQSVDTEIVTVTNSEHMSAPAENPDVANGQNDVPKMEEVQTDTVIISEPPKEKPSYFRITDEHLGEGSKREKFHNNVEAIKTLKRLEDEERPATPEEQETLSKYIGWGGLQEAFDDSITAWNAEYYELKNLLSEDEYNAARATVNDAFYTSPVITKAIYDGLENIGFKGGEVLEPSMGVGNFFGTMPDNMRANSNLSGVEIDSISGRIAQKLYPEASIAINGFEKVKPSKGAFDLAVGNVPFGTHGVNDKTKAYKGLLIHDYFFAKSLDSVRPDGVVAFVTSTGTLDKEDTKVRQMLAQKAELMGAVRLPNNAFQKNAGTQTSTDIIFLKKREKPLNIGDMAADKSCDWVHTKENKDGFKINSYFADNPKMVLGELSDKGRFGSIICTPVQGADLKEQLSVAMKNIKGEYIPLEFQQELDERADDKYLKATPDIENLTYTVVENKLYFRVDDNLIPLKESEQHGAIADRRKAMCDLGETTRELLKAQVEDRPDKEIKALQAELNMKYDRFAKRFGRINPIETPSKTNESGVSRKAPNSNVFKNDVRLPLLQSLEKMKEGQFIGKAEIFTERTIRPRQVAEHVETAQEALILSMSEKGKIDFGYMQDLTGFEKNKLIDDLHGDIYPVPELSTADNTVYQTADEYLSGNIYKKIAQAEEKIADNPVYAENIAALTQVIPPPLKATEIDMQLGMTWIDPKIIQQFMYEKFDTPQHFREYEGVPQKNLNAITVEFSGAGKGTWKIENASRDNSIKTTKNFGTKDYNAYELLEKILNSKSVAVTEIVKDNEGKQKTIILEKETRAAEDKVKLINAEFKKWIFADPERRNELVRTYNQKFNCIRPREYDGSNLNFFGSNPEITLKPHQKNAVAHALFGGNTLFAHQVGAGKTFEMIATAMEGKRLGLHNKSMFVVPNHLTEQIGSDFMKLYPNANILVAKPDDFSPQKRRQMCARIATGNFDAVIIGHSQLIKIPLSPKREEEFIRNQINDVILSLEAAKDTDSKSYTVKQLEATKAKLRERLEKLTNSTVKDNAVTFEELGVDKLFVDEAHEFKNLYVATKMENVSGLSTNADVQKTQDLYLKCQYLDEITGSKGIVFSTGTPVTNALSEMYTTMKYLQSDLLKETGLDSFDSWAGNFTRKSTDLEISPSGSEWKMKTRLKFTNVPELVTMFKECADIKMADQLNLDVPECSKNIVSVEPTEIQKRVVQSLGERAEKISKGAVSRTEDNMLVVTGDGRKLGLDQRLYDLSLPDEPQSKLNACVNNVHDIWASTADRKSTQLIFCDLGVPQSKEDLKKNGERFDVYADIRKKLIDKGIPEKEIAFIHEANSETEKAKLFAKVRSGDVRVLIGSTQKMGAGTNVQNKLIALHDLDCPWRPADLTQRLGRMVRQGNENDRVHNFRYVTKGTFDAYLYQMVEKKQASIAQIFTSKAIARTCDDIDDMAVDFMQVKMAAIGDDRIRRQMELREDIRSLNMLRNTYLENKYELQDNINELPKKIEKAEKTVEGIAADVKMIESYKPPCDIDGKEVFQMKVGGEVISGKKEAAEAFSSAMTRAIAKNPQQPTEIAEYKGFKISVSYDPFTRVHHGTLKGAVDYPFELGSSESGNMTRIENVIASVPKRTDVVCNDIERMKTELADSIKEVNEPFEHEAELAEKKQELDRLTEEINADKVKGKIAPEQPESTAEQPEEKIANSENVKSEPTADIPDKSEKQEQPENTVDSKENPLEKQPENSIESRENISEKTAEKLPENKAQSEKAETQTDETKENSGKEKPETLNIKWLQSGKQIKITFGSSAEKPITAFAGGKEVGVCKPEELIVTKIPDNEKKHYPAGITHCVKPLNIAFGSNIAEYITKFANKVKEICSKIKSVDKSLFSRDKVMSDKYKPTSSKDEKAPASQQEH
ncbi:MAG: DEAD/DEAH box helicase family protein [Ruminococcus sp.]|nr:DEAD/DEAH box helicase family protein [Ruminococcus sp.]